MRSSKKIVLTGHSTRIAFSLAVRTPSEREPVRLRWIGGELLGIVTGVDESTGHSVIRIPDPGLVYETDVVDVSF